MGAFLKVVVGQNFSLDFLFTLHTLLVFIPSWKPKCIFLPSRCPKKVGFFFIYYRTTHISVFTLGPSVANSEAGDSRGIRDAARLAGDELPADACEPVTGLDGAKGSLGMGAQY